MMKRFNIASFKRFLLNKGECFSQKGIALPVVLMVVGGLALAGAAAVGIATGEVGISRNDNGYKTAFNIAEAGIADATDAIGGNSTLLPRPLGGINSDSAQFSVQYNLPGTNGTGRYIITISLPLVTPVTVGNAGLGVNTDVISVANASGLAENETILIGNSTTHMTAIIKKINPNNQLQLAGSNGQPFTKYIDNTMFVSKNLINVLAEGEYGSGLQANYPDTSWRTAMSAAALGFTTLAPPLPAGGAVRSSATILSQYNVQSIPIFDSLEAKVDKPGSAFNGPLLVTQNLNVSPYVPGSYTGPIFAVNPSLVKFSPGPPPTIIAVPNTVVTASSIVASAAANVQCYQTACSAKAPAQIYSVNGYKITVYQDGSGGAIVSSEQQLTNFTNVFNTLTNKLPAITPNFTGQPTDKQNFNKRAVLFGGRLVSSLGSGDIGKSQAYDTIYIIHTSDNLHPTTDQCGESDIVIVAHTIVTYMGTRMEKTNAANGCQNPEQKYLFQFETIWNHTVKNGLNSGLQADDAEVQTPPLPHKGYYKWVRAVRFNDQDANEPLRPQAAIGDQEFNSVFNHSAKTNFHSAIVNWNISAVHLVGFSNPPAKAVIPAPAAHTAMVVNPQPFPTQNWLDAGQKGSVSRDEISGNYSSFGILPASNGFDFIGFGFVYFRDTNNLPYLLDASNLYPGNKATLYVGDQTISDVYGLNAWSPSNPPNPTATVDNGNNGLIPLYPTPPSFPQSTLRPPAATVITATNSGPATSFVITRGIAGLLFDPANSIAFNVASIKVETKSYGAPISIGSPANPSAVVTQSLEVEAEGCGAYIAWSQYGPIIASQVEFENNVTYTITNNLSGASACLTSGTNYVFLQRVNWKEIRK